MPICEKYNCGQQILTWNKLVLWKKDISQISGWLHLNVVILFFILGNRSDREMNPPGEPFARPETPLLVMLKASAFFDFR